MEIINVFNSFGRVVSFENDIIQVEIHDLQLILEWKKEELKVETVLTTFKGDASEGLVAIIVSENIYYYLHIKNKKIISTPYLNGLTPNSLNLRIELFSNRFILSKTTYSYELIDQVSAEVISLDYSLFVTGNKILNIPDTRDSTEPYVYLKISYLNWQTFLEYTIAKKSFSLKSTTFTIINSLPDLSLDFRSNNVMLLIFNGNKEKVVLNKLYKIKEIQLSNRLLNLITEPVLIHVNNSLLLIKKTEDNKNIVIRSDNRAELLFDNADYTFTFKKNHLLIEAEIAYKIPITLDSLITKDGFRLGKVVRVNKNQFEIAIFFSEMIKLNELHNTLYLALNNQMIHSMYTTNDTTSATTILTKVICSKTYVIRLNKYNVATLTVVPSLPVYNQKNQIFISLAHFLASKVKSLGTPPKINLFFEKEASKASESARFVFEQIIKDNQTSTKNFFVLDKHSVDFDKMRKEHGSKIVKRFSLRHYYLIFMANNFISSELSPHVIAGRVYHPLLQETISQKPLYFLQHGIMFAKPVDNPLGLGFHKENQTSNIIKNVISSDLEAKEFYKMGYNDSDLMKTGLPKLDGAYLKENANKIAFMPTWRFWEEKLMINNKIEQTTYYQTIMGIIKSFEEAGLLDRLLITAHNKFSSYISNEMKEYAHLFCLDPTEALKVSKIFITDYSSIIYDAIYRGAYPIFYWKEADYLIEKYKAIPPVNSENAPGAIAWSNNELISLVNNAIENNYLIPKETMLKYRKINEFHDNQNTRRVVNVLTDKHVI